jgi:hypothetical protein
MLISAKGPSVRSAVAAARRVANLELNASRVVVRSGGEDGLYRCTLADGNVVEVAVVRHAKAEALVVE